MATGGDFAADLPFHAPDINLVQINEPILLFNPPRIRHDGVNADAQLLGNLLNHQSPAKEPADLPDPSW
jgi:hypothetical protein